MRDLRTKINELYINTASCEYVVIILNETWLSASITDGELFASSYNVYRCVRNTSSLQDKKGGGGVLAAILKIISLRVLKDFESDCGDLWIEIDVISVKHVGKMLLCTVYLQPPVSKRHLKHFCNNANINLSNCGDFN